MTLSRNAKMKRLAKAKKRRAAKTNRQGRVGSKAKVRMSEVIGHLAEPIVDAFGDSTEDLEKIISLTIAAWNLSLLPPEDQGKNFGDMCDNDPELDAMFRWICDVVAERKLQYYPNLNYAIIDVQFTRESDDTIYYEVVYAHEPSQPR